MIELLAVTGSSAPPPPPLRVVRRDGLSMVWTEAHAPAEPSADDLWRHSALLERLMEDRDLLPVRYGTVVRDEDAAAHVLQERREELAAGLERVRGAVELALRVRSRSGGGPRPEAAAAPTGRAYLDTRAGGVRAATEVGAALAPMARESIVQPSGDLLRAAYLVDRTDVDAFVARVRALQDEHQDLALLCTGPWPPYSFTEGKIAR